ncbi:MAG: phenylalanine--tRNA ligase subunit beta [Endomicrobiaceae bacterium]|jgi:phenylalanyl-tRNA synthetase beta chain|nr:phenylalanine--tRNA ligase subunit beta [Endomicrobiaceae bacterium]MDD3729813.1 phenylalanine--tRNA ligase subunit beta [Endomicrobiaceae bacterium]MDD4166175.1 phenylalanine--tRNA ligase subunit beta [Endomicrobiaceae bacterium]
MKISYNWLKELIDFDLSPEELATTLTFLGVETSIASGGMKWTGVITAKVTEKQKHPNADKLSLCRVNDGTKDYEIVCGAANVEAGQIVPLALIGAVLPGNFEIKPTKIRGISSEGMICSEQELGLKDSSDGIMVLNPDIPLGKKLEDVLDTDTILEIEITSNRGDCLSHWGIAREISAKLEKVINLPTVKESKFTEKNIVDVQAEELCSRYIGCNIKDVKVAPAPKWMKDRLENCGIKSINNIVDITNYVMLELGHPMHAFDSSKVSGEKIIVRKAFDKEQISTLDNKTYELTDNMLVIADKEKALAVAGVIGGSFSAISDSTKDIFLESAVFEPGNIRKTSKILNLSTDSSYRFERGTSWKVAEKASWRAINLITELAGGRLETREDVNSKDNEKLIIQLRVERVKKILGYSVDEKKIANILRFLGIEISSKVQNVLIAEIPSWRNDIKQEIDLIEEIARIDGYDNIPLLAENKVVLADKQQDKNTAEFINALSDTLIGLGFCEAVNYSFAEIKDLDKLYLKHSYKIANPISKENEVLRPSLLAGLMKNLHFNAGQGTTDLKLFETGKIFDETGEHKAVGILMYGSVWQNWWRWEGTKTETIFDFNFASGIINAVLPKGFTVDNNKSPEKYYHPGKTASIMYRGKVAGQFGVLRPDITADFTNEVIYAEINADAVNIDSPAKLNFYKHISKFPAVKRDLSIVCDKKVPFEKIEKIIKQIMKSGGILKDFNLFSVYENEKLGDDKISYSLRLYYKHDDKTLNDAEVSADFKALIDKFEKDLAITLRS